MWWQHSRSAGVSVAPGSTHAIAGLAAHISTMLSNKAARPLVTAIIIALHHVMFENTGSVTGVTAWRVWDTVVADQKVCWLTTCGRGETGGERPHKMKSAQTPFRTTGGRGLGKQESRDFSPPMCRWRHVLVDLPLKAT